MEKPKTQPAQSSITVSVTFNPKDARSRRKAIKSFALAVAEAKAKATATKVDDVIVHVVSSLIGETGGTNYGII